MKNLSQFGYRRVTTKLFFLGQWKHPLDKHSVIDPFFAFAKRYYRLKYLQVRGQLKVTQHVFAV